MSPSDLIAAGERLYGPHWRRPLAEWLGVDVSTLRRWSTADKPIPLVVGRAIELRLEKLDSQKGPI